MFSRCCSDLMLSHADDGNIYHYPLGTDCKSTVLITHPILRSGGTPVEWHGDFGWLTGFDLEDICLAFNYLVLIFPVLLIPASFSNPCVTRRNKCKHVRLLFSANSLGNQCQTRLCLKTSLKPTTRKGDRVTFLVNQQLDFHFGTLCVCCCCCSGPRNRLIFHSSVMV